MTNALHISWEQAWPVAIAALLIYLILIISSRLVGSRSFAQFTAFDYAVTVALGAIVGSTAVGGVSLLQGATGLIVLFALRFMVAKLRPHGLAIFVDNPPILLMDSPKILPKYLRKAKITEEDLLQSLRKKGITNLQQVRAVVMERDGSISVLKNDSSFDEYMLKGVYGNPPKDSPKSDPPL